MVQNMLLKWITLIGIFITVVSSAPLSIRDALPPKNDPFYKPDAGFENEKPGTILRTRVLPDKSLAAFSALPQNIKGVYQFLYQSTNALGNATATVTTLMVPVNANPTKLVSYQTAEDSPTSDCAPSYTFQKGSGLKGPGSYFTVGKNSGNGVLDSIRAVLSTGSQTQLQADAQVQLWGYSGGALASGWAAQLQASYAPELKIIGAALGGTPVNLNATLNAVNKSPFCGLIPAGIHGLSAQYPELSAYIDSVLKPEKKQTFQDAANSCLAPLVLQFAFQDLQDYVTRSDYLNDPIATKVLEENIMGKVGTPKIPLFMYHSSHDEIVPFSPAEDMYNSWCSSADSGTSIEFVQDELSEHGILAISGAANAINFLVDGFDNKARKSGCSKRTTATSALDPGALGVFGKLIWDSLNALLGQPIGPNNIF
ncbi:unnamed protein product [Absidia cylindrospora]